MVVGFVGGCVFSLLVGGVGSFCVVGVVGSLTALCCCLLFPRGLVLSDWSVFVVSSVFVLLSVGIFAVVVVFFPVVSLAVVVVVAPAVSGSFDLTWE